MRAPRTRPTRQRTGLAPVFAAALCLALPVLAPSAAAERAAEPPSPADVTLTVAISELRNDVGRVAVALFDTENAFPDQKRALKGQVVAITGKAATVRFTDLRPGKYAVAVLHDENLNNEMDFNFVGIPLEGYGFSNDASAMFGPPSFSAAAFTLTKAGGRVRIKARYFSL